jgi:membrane protease YdiL (CAAX protease family)
MALPRLPGFGLLIAGIIFAFLNAFLEELLFRGIFFGAVESQTGTTMAVVITAALFGFGHMHGYPPGPTGAVPIVFGKYSALGGRSFDTRNSLD